MDSEAFISITDFFDRSASFSPTPIQTPTLIDYPDWNSLTTNIEPNFETQFESQNERSSESLPTTHSNEPLYSQTKKFSFSNEFYEPIENFQKNDESVIIGTSTAAAGVATAGAIAGGIAFYKKRQLSKVGSAYDDDHISIPTPEDSNIEVENPLYEKKKDSSSFDPFDEVDDSRDEIEP